MLSELIVPPKPAWKRFKTNDVTIEKLIVLLSENLRGILVFRDELIGLLRSFEKIGHETDRSFYLESWAGNGSHNSDRIERGSIYADNVCVSLLGTTQPDKLLKYLSFAMTGDNDGLIQRFQLMVYPDDSSVWQLVDRKPDTEARAKTFDILKRLTQMDFVSRGATISERFPYFRFDIEAQNISNEWIADLETNKLRNPDAHPLLVEHLSKFRSLMPSLALIFHVIELASTGNNSSQISCKNVALACAWCDYLETHAKRIYGLIIDVSSQAASILAKKIQRGKLKNGFTWRDLQRKNWTLLNNKKIAEEACETLVEMGWLKKITSPQGKTAYLINPKLNREDSK